MTHNSETDFTPGAHSGTFAGAIIMGQFAALKTHVDGLDLAPAERAAMRSAIDTAERASRIKLDALQIGIGMFEGGGAGAAEAAHNVAVAALATADAATRFGSPIRGVIAGAAASVGLDASVDQAADLSRNLELGGLIFDLTQSDADGFAVLAGHAQHLADNGHPFLQDSIDQLAQSRARAAELFEEFRNAAFALTEAATGTTSDVAAGLRDTYDGLRSTLGELVDDAGALRDAAAGNVGELFEALENQYTQAVNDSSQLMTFLDEAAATAADAAAATYDELTDALGGLFDGFVNDTQAAIEGAATYMDNAAGSAAAWIEDLLGVVDEGVSASGPAIAEIIDILAQRAGLPTAELDEFREQSGALLDKKFAAVREGIERFGEFFDGAAGPVADYVDALRASFGSAALAPLPKSPLVLDLDGDGLELTSLADSTTRFDHDGDTFREASGWVSADDGLLVRDLNNNGAIDSGAELFGTATRVGDAIAADGFTALAALDSNADGLISAADAAFAELRIWRDLDQDGKTALPELSTLADLGVSAISTTPQASAQIIAGHAVPLVATFTRSDGSSGTVADVFFNTDPLDTVTAAPVAWSVAALRAPALRGYGAVPSLDAAMSHDPGLLALVEDYAGRSFLRADDNYHALNAILFRWGQVDDLAPDARGGLFDARKLTFLEQFLAQPFVGHNGSPDPTGAALGDLETAWQTLVTVLTVRLQAQAGTTPALTPVAYDRVADTLTTTADAAALLEAARNAAPVGIEAETAYWAHTYQLLHVAIDGIHPGSNTLESALAAVLDGHLPAAVQQAIAHDTRIFTRDSNGNYTSSSSAASAIYADEHNNIIHSLGDNDLVFAGAGNDTINAFGDDGVYFGGTGNDVIGPVDGYAHGGAGNDTLSARSNAEIHGGDGNDLLSAYNQFGAHLFGGAGDDTLRSGTFGRANHFRGEAGDDVLKGGIYHDIYHFDRGDGHDLIVDLGQGTPSAALADRIVFGAAVTPDEVYVSREQGDLLLATSTDSQRISGWYSFGRHIESTEFTDGTRWDGAMLETLAQAVNGGAGADIFYGSEADDVYHGRDGDDRVFGRNGDNTLFGGAGRDLIIGGSGADSIDGGGGNDTIFSGHLGGGDRLFGGSGDDHILIGHGVSGIDAWGGAGNDVLRGSFLTPTTWHFGHGDGHDRFIEWAWSVSAPAGHDVLQLGPGITPADVRVSNDGYNWVLGLADSTDQFTAEAWYAGGAQLDSLRFEDGTQWAGSLLHDLGLIEQPSAGADIITGLGSHDDHLSGHAGDDQLSGLGGNDVLHGDAGNDWLDGGDGHNTLRGGSGDDTYWIGSADSVQLIFDELGSDRIELDATQFDPADLWFSLNNNDLVIDFVGASGSIVVQGSSGAAIETIAIGERTLARDGVEDLLAVMADFAAPASAEPLPLSTLAIVDPVVAQAWQGVL